MNEQQILINQALLYIEQNLQELLTVNMVAAAVGYSRFHLVRLFRAATGETIVSYIRKRRLHEAAQELVMTEKPILAIALDYQFQSQESFTRAFRTAFRCTPATHRRRKRYRRYQLAIQLQTATLVQARRIQLHAVSTFAPLVRFAPYAFTQRSTSQSLLWYR